MRMLPSKMVTLLVTIAFYYGRGKKSIKKTQPVDEDFIDNGEKNSPFFIQKLIPADETLLQILLKVKDTYVYLLWLPTY